MSAFDDEFGLFGDEVEEEERRSTLGARTISTGETIIDEIEPEDERAPRARRGRPGGPPAGNGLFEKREGPVGARPIRRRDAAPRAPLDNAIAHPRAVELLTFLAKKLVSKPDVIAVSLHPDDRGAVLELEVDPDDLGKVIGRGGRVAQALRTLVRAGAEGRVTVDIVEIGADDDDDDTDDVPAASALPAIPATPNAEASVDPAVLGETDADADVQAEATDADSAAAAKPKRARRRPAATKKAPEPDATVSASVDTGEGLGDGRSQEPGDAAVVVEASSADAEATAKPVRKRTARKATPKAAD